MSEHRRSRRRQSNDTSFSVFSFKKPGSNWRINPTPRCVSVIFISFL